ncbi:helix-turn-helix domain-containing protein [Solirubrobacter phytolaccae]|uniref:Helix-turn-helix domain-containing protein n=1 Tax=Solirubrobacter phytolaccae TaxID=1404360 RepID=A0A9X3S8P0_9ACTN|nr:helix-turn-helix domain-containing protein [Solirubrobacter phytolaccae]MDA0181713.1 helix-turn-helix domain-containing protein [Solirubrobacter phytolaccae]
MASPFPFPADATEPPPIPPARSDSTGHPRRPLLIWIRTGTAHVHIDDAAAFHLTAGQGAWIPADGWHHRAIVTEPGTVAFPLWPHPGAESLAEPTQFEVPDGWQDWLIQLFNLEVTPLSGRGFSQDAITDLLRRRPSPLPEIPRATGARAVAEELSRDPSLDLTVEQWATRAHSSPRTLRRDFLADTGITFEQWRLHNRLIAAVELLAAGYDVDQVAARVGFASRNGFTRAFKQQYGATPRDFSRELSASSASVDLTQRATLARQTDDLVRMVRGDSAFATAPDLLPAARTPPHANDMHVLSWIYRGSGYLDIGDHRYERQRGVATWIPAGLEHVTGLRENSVSLPLGDAGTGDLQLTEPLQVQFSPAWDDYLTFCSISARSGLHPDDYDPRHILDLFAEQVATQRALSVPMPTDPRAHAAAMEYLRRIDASPEPAASDLPADVHRAFRDETGMTFARWRYAARMRIARDLLAGGAKPSAIARRVGYRHLPTFSTAFTRFHGLSPREYQEREAEKA